MDKTAKKEHIQDINEEKRKIENSIREGICLKCGGKLVLRTASKGPNAGSKFYGCSNYPKCKFTAKAPQGFRFF